MWFLCAHVGCVHSFLFQCFRTHLVCPALDEVCPVFCTLAHESNIFCCVGPRLGEFLVCSGARIHCVGRCGIVAWNKNKIVKEQRTPKMPTHPIRVNWKRSSEIGGTKTGARCRPTDAINWINASLWYGKMCGGSPHRPRTECHFPNFVFISLFTNVCGYGWEIGGLVIPGSAMRTLTDMPEQGAQKKKSIKDSNWSITVWLRVLMFNIYTNDNWWHRKWRKKRILPAENAEFLACPVRSEHLGRLAVCVLYTDWINNKQQLFSVIRMNNGWTFSDLCSRMENVLRMRRGRAKKRRGINIFEAKQNWLCVCVCVRWISAYKLP